MGRFYEHKLVQNDCSETVNEYHKLLALDFYFKGYYAYCLTLQNIVYGYRLLCAVI